MTHAGSKAYAAMHAAMFELMRGDVACVAANSTTLARLAGEHDLGLWRAFGVFLQGCLMARTGEVAAGLVGMRRGLDLIGEQNAVIFGGLLKVAQAETENTAGDPDRALAILDEALATSERIGHRPFDAELHRARGEILLRRNPADVMAAGEAFQTAIAIAARQGARSFCLRAALALAKLYHSTRRPAEAQAVLAPALGGFSPTSEMPQIAEAQSLLQRLQGELGGLGGSKARPPIYLIH